MGAIPMSCTWFTGCVTEDPTPSLHTCWMAQILPQTSICQEGLSLTAGVQGINQEKFQMLIDRKHNSQKQVKELMHVTIKE